MPTNVDPTKNLGDDSTATFESDPRFVDSNPTENASTENVTVQRDTDDTEDSEEEIEDEDDEDGDGDEDEDEEEVEAAAGVFAAASSDSEDALDDDEGDLPMGIDEDDVEEDDIDTDAVTSGFPAASLGPGSAPQQLCI